MAFSDLVDGGHEVMKVVSFPLLDEVLPVHLWGIVRGWKDGPLTLPLFYYWPEFDLIPEI